MILLLDNFDSFTYNLVDYFKQLNVECKVLRNDLPMEEIIKYDFKGVVLSPGPEVPSKSGNLMQVLKHYYKKRPILGICLGHQAIANFFGGEVVKALRPMHGKVSKIQLERDIIFQGLPEKINVVRYNSLVVKNCKGVRTIAYTAENEIMALKHNDLPIWGLQFHPEAALTEHGLDILKNWLTYNEIAV